MASLRAEITALRRRIPPPMAPVDSALAADPALLAERVGLSLDPWQADLLRTDELQIILNVGRQLGKSTVTSILALHDCLFSAPALVLVVCPALRQAKEFFEKFKHAYYLLPPETRPPLVVDQALEWRFANGSRLVCIPDMEATVRGFSAATRIIVDEAARVEDALYYAVRPMLLVSGGKLMLLSTPWGRRGFFHETWSEREGWKRVEITAYDVPRISRERLEAERRSVPSWVFEQEFLCQFKDTEESYFSYDAIQAALEPETPDLFGGRNPYERIPA